MDYEYQYVNVNVQYFLKITSLFILCTMQDRHVISLIEIIKFSESESESVFAIFDLHFV